MKKYSLIILVAIVILGAFSAFEYLSFHDGKLHVIFCDVGQGDGILIRTPSRKILLFDGGPDDKILACLSRHTPFWEHTITLMLLSHPHADHVNGLISALDRYSTKYFATERLVNNTAGFTTLQEVLKMKHIPQKIVYGGDSASFSDQVSLDILGPSSLFLKKTSPNGVVGESKEFANIIALLTYKQFRLLLVGDSQAPQVEAAASLITPGIDVMQVPHHGSLTGLSEKALSILSPKLAVISVGKNSYGHPSKYTLNLLKNAHIVTRMTVTEGDIEIVSSGKSFTMQ